MVKNHLLMQERWETRVQFLGGEDSLEGEMVTHSSILAWRIPWTEEPEGPQSKGWQRVGHHRATRHSTATQIHTFTESFGSV